MFLNILLVLLMVASLGGMLFCGKGRRTRPALQLIALLLLVLVIVSGGMFMCRLGALSVLGVGDDSDRHLKMDQKLREAQGFVIGNYIKNTFPGRKNVLLISRDSFRSFNTALALQLREAGSFKLMQEIISDNFAAPAADKLLTPGAEQHAEGSAIDAAIARHPEAQVVILVGVSSAGEAVTRLKVYRMNEAVRPKIIVVGINALSEWFARQIEHGGIAAVVLPDFTKPFRFDEVLPENPVEIFSEHYVLITPANLKRNRRFFR